MSDDPTQLPVKRLGPGDDLEMINSPHLWPWRPVLPVINPTKMCPFAGELGMPGMIIEGEPTTVYVGLIFLGPTAQCFRYESVAELLADQWRVD